VSRYSSTSTSPSNPAKRGGNEYRTIYRRPFREFVVAVPGLAGSGGMFAKGRKDNIEGITGLKPRKERVRGQVFLHFQSGIEG